MFNMISNSFPFFRTCDKYHLFHFLNVQVLIDDTVNIIGEKPLRCWSCTSPLCDFSILNPSGFRKNRGRLRIENGRCTYPRLHFFNGRYLNDRVDWMEFCILLLYLPDLDYFWRERFLLAEKLVGNYVIIVLLRITFLFFFNCIQNILYDCNETTTTHKVTIKQLVKFSAVAYLRYSQSVKKFSCLFISWQEINCFK